MSKEVLLFYFLLIFSNAFLNYLILLNLLMLLDTNFTQVSSTFVNVLLKGIVLILMEIQN